MNPKLILALSVIGLVVVSNAFTGWKAYGWGQNDIQGKWDKAVAATVDQKIDTKAKQDEIQNAPIDTAVTVRRLRDGSF